MKLRLVSLCSALLILSGCNSTPQPGSFASAEPEASMAPPARALVWLPPQAGKVISVLEQRRSNGLVQEIALSGEASVYGENKIIVTAISNADLPGKYATPNQADVSQPSEADIAQELAEKFSNIEMGIGDTVEHNIYGPFGYAVGKQKKVGCLYAWQTIGRSEPKKLLDASIPANTPVSIRVKICRNGADPMALVTLIRQLSIGGVGSAVAPAYGNVPLYNAPGAGDALAASGLGAYNVASAQYGSAPYYNAPHGGNVALNGYPASAFGTQIAADSAPRTAPRKRVVRVAAKHRARHYASRQTMEPQLNIPMPDGAGASYTPAPQASAAVFRAPVKGGGAAIPMP